MIAHLDCDAFYATVELTRRPELKGRPLIVAGSGPRAVVTTASYEARKFGVGSAMPASRARRLCPDAVVIPPDFEAYRATSKAVWETVRAPAGPRAGDGARRGLRGPDRRAQAAARAARARGGGARQDGRDDLGRGRPVAPGREVLQRSRQAGRPGGDGARGGVRALRDRADQPGARDRPEDGGAAGGDRPAHDRPAPARGRGAARHPLRDAHGRVPEGARGVPRRLAGRDGVRPGEVLLERDDLRRGRRRPRRAGVGRAADVARAVRGARQARAARAHDRHQGAPGRLDQRHPRALDRGADQRRRAGDGRSRSSCCAPTRRPSRCG